MVKASPQLPLNADGICMLCKVKPAEEATLTCVTCATPWHVDCLSVLPETMASALKFECPDCSGDGLDGGPAPTDLEKNDLFTRIREIEADDSLSEKEKARRRQQLLSGKMEIDDEDGKGNGEINEEKTSDILGVLGESFKCSYCMELPERPVTIPTKMASQPRINSTLVSAIRMAKLSRSITSGGPQIVYRFLHNQDRPDKAFTTERAQRAGMANAASGRIFVTVPKDHFGPIRRRMIQKGIRGFAGIAGRAHYGAQSVVISGGYEDDEDNGEWFIYTGSVRTSILLFYCSYNALDAACYCFSYHSVHTYCDTCMFSLLFEHGSGGRDLSGNKRTNKEQSFDQEFKEQNQSLRVSCDKGYPVRVVRSEKDKRSSYAPEKGYRYDGVYRIEKCWRKAGKQGFKVCRYLFVRCDNEPAPWTSDEHGDRPRQLPVIPELKHAIDVTERKESPSWDYDVRGSVLLKWKRPPPPSEERVVHVNPEDRENTRKLIRKSQTISMREKLLKGFCCLICDKVMNLPLTTPCAHNFCKPCLENKFAGQTFSKERVCQNGRKLRSQKNVLNCPACPTDISEFLQNPQVNREIMEVIERLQSEIDKEQAQGKHEDSLKRKSSMPNLSDENEDMETISKKAKVDSEDGHESEPSSVEKPGDDCNNILQSSVPKGRGRPKKGVPTC
ncbi:hypothetical protein DH2020_018882 [Rehmannia glutinosa]|uniref:RING-type E3 ubiquitin transferase n=1 Tax=Rehmannia glutinosa TaxID=99300 RepID=A0ABR0WPB0_REHGL